MSQDLVQLRSPTAARAVNRSENAAGWTAAGLSLYVLIYFAWFFLGRSPGNAALVSLCLQAPAGLTTALLALLASRPAEQSPRARRSWRLLAFAFALYAIGDLLWLLTHLGLDEEQILPAVRFCYFTHYILILLALVSFQRIPRSKIQRLTFALDAATVFLGGLMVLWYFVIGPLSAAGLADRKTVLVQTAFVLADLQVLFGIAVNGVRRGEERFRAAFLALLSSLVALLVGDVIYARHRLAGTSGDGGPADAIFMARWLLMGLAAFLYLRAVRRGGLMRREAAGDDRFQIVPFLAVGVGTVTLIASGWDHWSPTECGLVLAAVGLTGLVLARQVTTIRDNLRLATEAAARQTEARFRSLVQNASDLIIVVDDEGVVRYQSPSAERVLGYGPEALVGKRFATLLPAEEGDYAPFGTPDQGRHGSTPTELRLRRGDERWTRAEVVATNLLEDPNVRGVVLTIRDIEERKHFEERLRHQALHDSLTGLPNRAMLADRVAHAQARIERSAIPCSLLLLDLDDFKTINDSLGHGAGDEVLVEVARRLLSCLRASDTAARLGGDEFAVLLEDIPNDHAALEVAARIASAIQAPMRVAGTEVSVTASLGIVVSGRAEPEGEIFRNADVAMYQAKKRGKGLCVVYEPGMHAAVLERLKLEADLRRALDQGEIVLHFQPWVDLRTGKWIGAEALSRWAHPTRGLVMPATFIPVAETTGLILSIGRHVLEEACRLAAEWGANRQISVNISARQVQEPTILAQVASALRHSGMRPDQLVIEITESVLMVETESTIERLKGMKDLGVRVAIDDFGTGYSSLAYLQNLPVDILKLDHSFIRGMSEGDELSPVARGVIDLARALNLEVVAEGIEQEGEYRALLRAGCHIGQGYLFAKPMEAQELRRQLSGARSGTALPALSRS